MIISKVKATIIAVSVTVAVACVSLGVYAVVKYLSDQVSKIEQLTASSIIMANQISVLGEANKNLSDRLDQVRDGLEKFQEDVTENSRKTDTLAPKLKPSEIKKKTGGDIAKVKELVNVEFNSYIRTINDETTNN